MALVFLFALASVGLMLKVSAGGLNLVTAFAMTCFVALAAGVFIGALTVAKHGEDEG